MCPYTCRSIFFCTLSFFDQLPTSRDDEQESLTDAAHTYTTQQEEQARWNGEEKKKMTDKTPPIISSPQPRKGKRPWDRARISLHLLALWPRLAGPLALPCRRCRKQPHGALASPAKTKSRDDLVRHRHEPRSLLKHHTEINKRIKPSAKTTNGIRFQNRLPIRTRISG